ADRRARADIRVLVDAVRPEDLLGRRQLPRGFRVGPAYLRRATNRVRELPPSDLDDPAGPPDVLFLRRERRGLVGLAAGLVRQHARYRIERKHVAFLRILDGLATLHDVQA